MRIAGSMVSMQSLNERAQVYKRQESLQAWVGSRGERRPPAGDRVELSPEARRTLEPPPAAEPSREATENEDETQSLSPRDRTTLLLLEKLFHVKVNLLTRAKESEPVDLPEQPAAAAQAPPSQPSAGWGVRYDLHESYEEREDLKVDMKGIIKTKDGKEITFDVQLQMSRRFAMERNVRLRGGDAKKVDPLVINYDGPAADLAPGTFHFDLDGDGLEENLSLLKPGSGFLALDGNGDGVINNGSELFGPATGDGYGELAQYDVDGSGWIDADDPIYERLRIWSRDEQGNDLLFALGQKGIGAIFVGNIGASFTVTDASNRALGQNQRASLFVRENGTVGTTQQLDLII